MIYIIGISKVGGFNLESQHLKLFNYVQKWLISNWIDNVWRKYLKPFNREQTNEF